jgi:hypothetical protein
MFKSIVSHFTDEPLCVGCETERAERDLLCRFCYAKVGAFIERMEQDRRRRRRLQESA